LIYEELAMGRDTDKKPKLKLSDRFFQGLAGLFKRVGEAFDEVVNIIRSQKDEDEEDG